MIPVAPQPEPTDFDKKVRQPGLKWLEKNNIAQNAAPPEPSKLPSYWTRSNKQLWDAYSGVCAYLAIYFPYPAGSSTDHFIPKSQNAGKAYEWDNYRLSCRGPNEIKGSSVGILDPFTLVPDTFLLDLPSGKIYPNPNLSPQIKAAAIETVRCLRLDSPDHNEMRAGLFSFYMENINNELALDVLRRASPFVYSEVIRQKLTT